MDTCEFCGKNRKRYRSAFGTWICDNCKKETINYNDRSSGLALIINEWWNYLDLKLKIEIYEKYTKAEHSKTDILREQNKNGSDNIEKPKQSDS